MPGPKAQEVKPSAISTMLIEQSPEETMVALREDSRMLLDQIANMKDYQVKQDPVQRQKTKKQEENIVVNRN